VQPFPRHVSVLVAEKQNTYYRFILTFTADFTAYSVRTEADISYEGINFTVLENDLCILLASADEFQVFKGNKVHKFERPPINANIRMFTESGGVFFLNGTSCLRLRCEVTPLQRAS